MQARHRLTGEADFRRVRRTGTSYSHPLFVLVVSASELPAVRLGVSASRSMGTAVRRNRAKRRLRETFRPLMPDLPGGWDLVVVARPALLEAEWQALQAAARLLLKRAGLQRSESRLRGDRPD
ncbi:MAG: ribonuclease P protein component [Anaerolineales bacterium]|nr:ribonuclease P protein component [Anaerolineales bacterium]